MYGTQTHDSRSEPPDQFENDVEMYGTQTTTLQTISNNKFENDVEMYGTQTGCIVVFTVAGLRMM